MDFICNQSDFFDVATNSCTRDIHVSWSNLAAEPTRVDTSFLIKSVLSSSRRGLCLEDPRGHLMKALALAPQVLAFVL